MTSKYVALAIQMNELTLSYSLADQSFERTKSLGILNLSVQLAHELARANVFQRLSLFSNHTLDSRVVMPAGAEVRHFDGAATSSVGRVAWDQWQCYAATGRSQNQWLFLPKGFASFVRKPPVKLAAYVHDAMHDFYAERFPTAMPAFERWYFRKALIATLRDTRVIFTNTEFTRTEVCRLAKKFGVREPRTCVAGIGFHSQKEGPAAGERNRVLVSTGRWPHKRSDLAVDWVRRWQQQTRFDGEIYVVGALPDGVAVPSDANWKHHVRLGESEYSELLGTARVLVYFSVYEGFGMPPVEATLAGACAVFSDLPVTREVMRDAGQRFANDSFESFCHAMETALTVSSETIESWSRELLLRHSWENVVQRIITGLREAD